MRVRIMLLLCMVAAAAAGAGSAAADTMHPELGARLSGMGQRGVVNLKLEASRHEICWAFDLPTSGVRSASVRDADGMVVAKLGAKYTKKGCAMVAAKSVTTIETTPTKFSVWVDTKTHVGELRGRLFVGMAHM